MSPKWGTKKVVFLMFFGPPGPYGAKWSPEGRKRCSRVPKNRDFGAWMRSNIPSGVSSPGLRGKSYGGSPLTCPGRKEWVPGVVAMIHYFYNFEAWKMMPENGEIGVPKWLQKVKEIWKSRLLHALGRGSET